MDFDVFISYSSKDKPAADAACAVLESSGIRCWIAPRDVVPGVEYGSAIVDAIEHCRVMVLIFSSNANELAQIRREIERAVKKGVTIIPVRIEEVEPTKSMEYFLGAIHWLDALTPPLEQHLQHLATTIKAMLQAKDAQQSAARERGPRRRLPAITRTCLKPGVPPQSPSAPRRACSWPPLSASWRSALIGSAVGLYAFLSPAEASTRGAARWLHQLNGGEILRYYPSPTQEDCRADCERDGENCLAYTWVKPGGYQPGDGPVCYLSLKTQRHHQASLLHHRQSRRHRASWLIASCARTNLREAVTLGRRWRCAALAQPRLIRAHHMSRRIRVLKLGHGEGLVVVDDLLHARAIFAELDGIELLQLAVGDAFVDPGEIGWAESCRRCRRGGEHGAQRTACANREQQMADCPEHGAS